LALSAYVKYRLAMKIAKQRALEQA
jgi:hypothetical protein